MELRSYQRKALDFLDNTNLSRNIIWAPTGSGKTVIMAAFIARFIKQVRSKCSVIVLINREELLSQTSRALERFNINHGIIKSGYSSNYDAKVQIASAQTMILRENIWSQDIKCVIYDEAHSTFFCQAGKKLLREFPLIKHIGFTATPIRNGKESILDIVPREGIYKVSTVLSLEQQGFLSPLKYYSLDPEELQRANSRNRGKFTNNLSEKTIIFPAAVNKWKEITGWPERKRRTVVFCPSIEYAKSLAEYFSANGIPFESANGNLDTDERETLYDALQSGFILGLTTCEMLTTGWDMPALEVAILLIKTSSLIKLEQIAGRIRRIYPGKTNGFLIDFGGNILQMGIPGLTTRLDPELTERESIDSRDSLKACPACNSINQKNAVFCLSCGHVFSSSSSAQRPLETITSIDEVRVDRDRMLQAAYRSMLIKCYEKKVSPASADVLFKEQYKIDPLPDWRRKSLGLPKSAYSNYLNQCVPGLTQNQRKEEMEKEFRPLSAN